MAKKTVAESAEGRLGDLEKRVARLWSLAVPPVLPLRRAWRLPRRGAKGTGAARPAAVARPMEISPGSMELYQWDSQEPVAFVYVAGGGGIEWWAMRTGSEDSWIYDPPSSDDTTSTSEVFVPLSGSTFSGTWESAGTDHQKASGFATKVKAYYTATYGTNPLLELTVHKNTVTDLGPF